MTSAAGPAILVAAGIIRRNDQFLACQRRSDSPHPGKWEFPGGKVEPGETPAEALRRELREELGIEADVGNELWRGNFQYAALQPVELIFFSVTSYRGAINDRQFAQVRWAKRTELAGLDFLEADRHLIELLVSGRLGG